jgi:hypothetical protein
VNASANPDVLIGGSQWRDYAAMLASRTGPKAPGGAGTDTLLANLRTLDAEALLRSIVAGNNGMPAQSTVRRSLGS